MEAAYKVWETTLVSTLTRDHNIGDANNPFLQTFGDSVDEFARRMDAYISPVFTSKISSESRLSSLQAILSRAALFQIELKRDNSFYEYDFLQGWEKWHNGWMEDVEEEFYMNREIDLNGLSSAEHVKKWMVVCVTWPALVNASAAKKLGGFCARRRSYRLQSKRNTRAQEYSVIFREGERENRWRSMARAGPGTKTCQISNK